MCYMAEGRLYRHAEVLCPSVSLNSNCAGCLTDLQGHFCEVKIYGEWGGQPEVLANQASILFPSRAGFISRATEPLVFTSDLHNFTLDFWFSLQTSLDSDGWHVFFCKDLHFWVLMQAEIVESSLSLASSHKPKL